MGAGIAALEGRRAEALAAFLDALHAYQELGLQFDEAAAAVDLAVLLPGIAQESAAAADAIAAARDTLTKLGAAPFLASLEHALGTTSGGGSKRTGATARVRRRVSARV
jgi:septal ring factor EnvC (AmiA/AmiB activator)